ETRQGYDALYDGMKPYAKALSEKRFEDLDRKLNALAEDRKAGRINDNELKRWYQKLFASADVALEPLLRDWVAAYPRSSAPLIASAFYYDRRGFAARGTKFASDTSSSQFEAMGLEFRNAITAINEAESLSGPQSLTEALRFNMLAAGQLDAEQIRKTYRRLI